MLYLLHKWSSVYLRKGWKSGQGYRRTNTAGRCNGKVIGEFVCDYILQRCEMANADIAEQQSCVRREDIYFKYSEEENAIFTAGISPTC